MLQPSWKIANVVVFAVICLGGHVRRLVHWCLPRRGEQEGGSRSTEPCGHKAFGCVDAILIKCNVLFYTRHWGANRFLGLCACYPLALRGSSGISSVTGAFTSSLAMVDTTVTQLAASRHIHAPIHIHCSQICTRSVRNGDGLEHLGAECRESSWAVLADLTASRCSHNTDFPMHLFVPVVALEREKGTNREKGYDHHVKG